MFHWQNKITLILTQNQLQGKEEIINTKEKEIKEYRLMNQHLNNFKTVYDYRVTTLQEERQPIIEHSMNMDVYYYFFSLYNFISC